MAKPIVGILYSDDNEDSQESYFVARYIGALLVLTGYAEIRLVGLTDYSQDLRTISRIKILHPLSGKSVDAPASDIGVGKFSTLFDCDVIIVTVNPKDSDLCGRKLSNLFTKKSKIVVFCLQRGVKYGEELSKQLSLNKSITILEGIVGFAVVPHPKTGVLSSTVCSPGVTLYRLTKEVALIAEGPLNLLEHTNLTFLYTKTLTVHAWGVLMYESIYALNAVTGGTMRGLLDNWRWRVILSCMIREQIKALNAAARGGAWKPNLSLVAPSIMTPKLLEMLLLLPSFVLFPLMAVLQFRVPALPSPILVDLNNGRRTSVHGQLEEFLSTGMRHKVAMPICEAVLHQIRALETTGVGSKLGHSTSPQMMASIEALVFRTSPSGFTELRVWMLRFLTAVSVLLLLLFLLS